MQIVDYAYPTMMAEKALRDLHNAMLDKDFIKAEEHARTALVEVKMAYNAIKHAQEMQ
jgi:hypothetical protein